MVKLRRFGVVAPPRAADRVSTDACVQRLESSGVGPPIEIAPGGDRRLATVGPLAFILDLSGAATLAGDEPPFGVWSFDAGDDPWGWRATTACRPSFRGALVARLADGTRVVLQEGVLPAASSYRRTRAAIDDVLAAWVARAAAEIEAGGWTTLRREPAADRSATPHRGSRSIFTLAASSWRRLRHWWSETARYDTWNVAIAALAAPLEHVDDLRALRIVRWLPAQPPLYFVADPFPYRVDGRDALLVEEYGHAKGVRGRIARVELNGSGRATVTPVIVRDTHLSYPFTLEDGADVYCAAEMGQEDGCIIYRLGPDGEWAAQHHILRGHKIVDPTFVRIDDTWWLFCTDDRAAGNLALHAYFGRDLVGPWTAHALNPLKCDLASARPAGRPFTVGGRLYRPAQDCSETYGGAVNVMEIVELSPTRFREAIAVRLQPDPTWPYPHGLHHLVVDGCRVYIDAKRRRYDHLLWLKVWLHRASA
jgi:hypothetical protein